MFNECGNDDCNLCSNFFCYALNMLHIPTDRVCLSRECGEVQGKAHPCGVLNSKSKGGGSSGHTPAKV